MNGKRYFPSKTDELPEVLYNDSRALIPMRTDFPGLYRHPM